MRCLRRIASLAVVLFTLAVSAEAGTADETLSNASMLRANTLWKGDLDGMAARRVIRVLVVYSKTFYFLDGPQQRGLSYELLKEFESFVNRKFKTKTLKIQLVIIPVARDELLPALLEGRGDLAVANLTVTTQRRRKVDFSDPFIKGVSELVISRADAAPIERLEDLAGRTITLRRSSSY
ncbi:MAG: transporter substrate-binding domain-containing protein, partial [Desulfobacterales bacterium]|nr:transporter substrate-binding domain-containing protein [Desulfobacterales bacterium]